RASALRVHGRPGDVALNGTVELAEISGSDTFVHVATPVGELVAQLSGVHVFDLGAPITLHLNPSHVHVFDQGGALLVAPHRAGGQRCWLASTSTWRTRTSPIPRTTRTTRCCR